MTKVGAGPLTGTYRLQLHAGFGFAAAEKTVPYLHRLGISHLYLSPVLQAAPGSMHGYDVIDHTRVSDGLGGREGLQRLADTAHEHGMGIVVDVVPNHMGVPTPEHLNPPFWGLLASGPNGRYGQWFDIDWTRNDSRIALPILDGPIERAISEGTLALDKSAHEPMLAFGDHRLPLAPGTADLPLDELARSQHYALADWRDKDDVLNYRRFFDVDTLIAVRVDVPEVFAATHAVLLDLQAAGVVDGFRIDHPDGLADPEGYLRMLADASGHAWVVVEKILGPHERLPETWSCAGTTGYDAITAVQAALVPADGRPLDERWHDAGGDPSYARVELESTREAVATLLEPEVRWLARLAASVADRDGQPIDAGHAAEAVRELLAHTDVYRGYARLGEPMPAEARAAIQSIARRASRARPDLRAAIERLVALVTGTMSDDPVRRDLVVRYQQVCGPARAKGVEDTAFYRWHRLVALNEVGGDPGADPDADLRRLTAWAAVQAADHPDGLVCLTTHDTKRSGDARARLIALASDVEQWDAWWRPVWAIAADEGLDAPTAYLIFQTLVAAWPISEERLHTYLTKAVREAKQHTSWTDPDQEYEDRVMRVASRAVTEVTAVSAAGTCLAATRARVRAVTLAATILHLTLPGVPDVYQGTELVTRTLVDPDNRRPVDYEGRERLLDALDTRGAGGLAVPGLDEDARLDREKLWVTSRLLRLRQARPTLLSGPGLSGSGYAPLRADSPRLIAFRRGDSVAVAVPRWTDPATRAWDGAVELPEGDWTDALTGRRVRGGGSVAAAELFAHLPGFVGIRGSR